MIIKDGLSKIHIYFWRRVSCTTMHIIKAFLLKIFIRTHSYENLLKLPVRFKLQLLY